MLQAHMIHSTSEVWKKTVSILRVISLKEYMQYSSPPISQRQLHVYAKNQSSVIHPNAKPTAF